MTTPQDVQQFIGRTAVDSEGSKVGKIGQIYLDERTGLPLWVTVATGMFGTRQSFAPISGSRFDGDQVTLAVSKEVPVGFRAIRLRYILETAASPEQVETLIRLTERYCVVYQTVAGVPELSSNWETA